MTAARFLELRRPVWDRIEALLDRAKRGNLRLLTEEELHELTRLYPTIAVDVARARAYRIDTKTLRRINLLAVRAHGLLYRRRKTDAGRAVGRFFLEGFPRLFRRTGAYVLLSAALLIVSSAGTYATVVVRPTTAYLFVPGRMDDIDGNRQLTAEDMSERFRRMPGASMAAGITTNNISVAFNAFALGITGGIGTCYVVLFNGMMVGGMAAHFANHGLSFAFWSYILPHGLLEIFAIVIAAAAGLRLGLSLVMPGSMTRKASLRAGAREAVLLVLGTIPMFVVAGAVESFVTPSELAGELKIALGFALLMITLGYLLIAGRRVQA